LRPWLVALEISMKAYIASFAAGILVGVIYTFLNVRSPAPPAIALVGLLGILLGEQIPSLARQAFKNEKSASARVEDQVKPHVFGHLPQCKGAPARLASLESPPRSSEGTHHG
jgi:XapX domain-containing protein